MDKHLVLSIANLDSLQKGAAVHMAESNHRPSQFWRLTAEGYLLSAVKSTSGEELVLDVASANTDAGAEVQLWIKNDTDAQKWSFNGKGQLVSKMTGFALDIKDSNDTIGAKLQMCEINGNLAQSWNYNETYSPTSPMSKYTLLVAPQYVDVLTWILCCFVFRINATLRRGLGLFCKSIQWASYRCICQ